MQKKRGRSGGDVRVAEPASNLYMMLSDCLKAILNCLPWAEHQKLFFLKFLLRTTAHKYSSSVIMIVPWRFQQVIVNKNQNVQ